MFRGLRAYFVSWGGEGSMLMESLYLEEVYCGGYKQQCVSQGPLP